MINSNSKLTLKQATAQVRQWGCSLRKVDGEYIVRLKADGGTYYTDCIEDAVNTARAMGCPHLKLVRELNTIIATRNLYLRGEKQNERVVSAHLRGDVVCVTGLYSELSIPVAGKQFADGYGVNVPVPVA